MNMMTGHYTACHLVLCSAEHGTSN